MPEATSKNTNKYISLQEASDYSPYSQEYLSLLARKGKIKAKKIGRNWFITRENLDGYLKKQSVLISLPKNIFNQQSQNAAVAQLASSSALTPEEEENQSSGVQHTGHSKLFEEFERLNPQIFQSRQPQDTNTPPPQQPTPPQSQIYTQPIFQSSQQPQAPQQISQQPMRSLPKHETYPQLFSSTSEQYSQVPTVNQVPSQQPPAPVIIQNIQAPVQDSHDIQDEKVMSKLDKLSDSLANFADKIADVLPKVVDATKNQSQPQVQTERIIERIIEKSDLSQDQKEFIEIQKQSIGYKVKKLNHSSRNFINHPTRMMAVMLTAIIAIFLVVGGFSFGHIDDLALAVKKAFTDSDTLGGHFPGTHANEVLLLDKSGNVSIFGHIETEGQLRSHAPEGVAPIVVDSMTKIDNLNADYLDDLSAKDFTLAYVTKNGNITYEDVFLEGSVEIGKALTVKGAVKLTDSLSVYGKLGVFSDAVFGKDVTLTNGNINLNKGNIDLDNGNINLDKGTIVINNNSLIKNLNAEYLSGITKEAITLDFVTDNGNSTSNDITVGGIVANGTSFFNKGIWGSSGSFGSLGVRSDASIGDSTNPNDSRFQVYSKYFSVNSSGNVGIGGNLIVSGNINSSLVASGSYDLGAPAKRWDDLYVRNIDLSGDITSSGSLSFSDILYINIASRSVGIGTSQPETKLEVVGTASVSNLIVNNSLTVNGNSNFGGSASISGNLEVLGILSADSIIYNTASVANNFQVGGVIKASDGSAGNPSYTFTSDLDTGLFRIGSNVMGVTTGGVERLRITDNGASLSGNFDPSTNNTYDLGDPSYRWRTGYFGTSLGIGISSAPTTTLEVSGTASISNVLFTTGNNGNVGIGTTAPAAKLNVDGGNILNGATSTGLGHNRLVEVSGTTPAFALYKVNGAANAKIWDFGAGITSDDLLSFRLVNDAVNSATDWLTVERSGTAVTDVSFPTGNVGIGTTVPVKRLEITSGTDADGVLIKNTGGRAYLSMRGNADTSDSYLDFQNSAGSSEAWLSWQADIDVLRISTGVAAGQITFETAAQAEAMRIDSLGNVGIGTTSPLYKTHIFGANAAPSLTVASGIVAIDGGTATNQLTVGSYSASPFGFWLQAKDNGLSGQGSGASYPISLNPLGGNVGIGTTTPSSFKLEIAGNIGPDADGTRDLGSASRKWNNLYVNNLQFSTASVSGNFDPSADNTYDLGDPSYRWRTGYFGTSLGINNGGVLDTALEIGGTASISGNAYFGANVGIGTTSPDSLLHLYKTGGNSTLKIESSLPNGYSLLTTKDSGQSWTFGLDDSDFFFLQDDTNSKVPFKIQSNAPSTSFYMNNSGYVGLGGVPGTGRLYVDGNVGIGTTSPAAKLDVRGTDSVSAIFKRTQAAAQTRVQISNNDRDYYLGLIDGVSFGIAEGGSTKVTVQATSGNVGIGTTSPGAKLQIDSTTATTIGLILNSTDDSATKNLLEIQNQGVAQSWMNRSGKLYIGPGASVVTSGTAPWLNVSANQVLIGSDLGAQTRTDATAKVAYLTLPAYTNANKPFTIFGGTGGSGTNEIGFGGGTSSYNAATVISFWTAANNNTVTGTERMRITSDGNVGIGTTAPDNFKLQVSGDVGPTTSNTYDLGSATYKWKTIYAASISAEITPSGFTAGPVVFGGSGGELAQDATNFFWDDSNNRLGIGTTGPVTRLDVWGGSAGTVYNGQLQVAGNETSGAIDTGGGIAFYGNDGSSARNWGAIQLNKENGTVGNVLSYFRVSTRNATGLGERFRINSSGNVGIGTTAPTYLLDAKKTSGYAEISAWSTDTAAGGIVYTQANTATNYGALMSFGSTATGNVMGVAKANYTYLTSAGSASNGLIIGTQTADNLSFGTNDAVNMTIQSGGNVGIGTTTPSSFKLEIAGNIGPDADGTRDLGSASRKWNNIYVNNLQFSTASVSGNFDPSADNTYDLGDPSYRWRTGYFGTSLGIGISSAPTTTLEVSGTASISNVLFTTGNNGNVGIGTTVPASLLHIESETAGTASEVRIFKSAGADGARASLKIGYDASNYLEIYRARNAADIYFTSSQSGANQQFTTTGAGSFIFNNGNVGIGTTAPLTKLNIQHTDVAGAQTVTLLRLDRNSTTSVGDDNYIDFAGNNSDVHGRIAMHAQVGGNSDLSFWTATASTPSEKVRILASGNVGIGTTTPSSFKLEIAGNIGPDADGTRDLGSASRKWNNLYVNNLQFSTASVSGNFDPSADNTYDLGDPSYRWRTGYFGTSLGIGISSAPTQTLSIQGIAGSNDLLNIASSSGTSILRVTKGGNVGIGTTAPLAKLQIGASSPVRFPGDGWYDIELPTDTLGIVTNAYYNAGQKYRATAAATRLDTGEGMFTFHTAPSATADDTLTWSEKLRIDNSGNVGIGTTVPTGKLEVQTTDVVDVSLYNGAVGLRVMTTDSAAVGKGGVITLGGSYSGTTQFGFAAIRGAKAVADANADGYMGFYVTKAGSGSVERVRIDTEGNVGIGTTTPSSFKLEIAGNIGPDADGTRDLGSASRKWNNIYVNNLQFSTASVSGNFDPSADNTYDLGDPSYRWRTGYFGTSLGIGISSAPTTTLEVSGTASISNVLFTTGNNGNVGIGTTAPQKLLHLSGATNPSVLLTDSTNGEAGTDGLLLQAADNVGYLINQENGPLYLGANSGTQFVLTAGGNVGIGTTNPTNTLDVNGGFRVMGATSGVVNGAGAEISYTGGVAYYQAYNRAGSAWLPAVLAGSYSSLWSNNSEVLRATSGNVGIGTTTPSSFKLEIAGNIGPDADGTRDLGSASRKWNNIYVNNLQFSTASVSGNFDPSADNTYDLGDPSYRWRTGYFGTSLGIGISSAPTTTLEVSGTASISNVLFTTGNNGNVGIGTTVPASLLDVAGKITATGGNVRLSNNYKLTGNLVAGTEVSLIYRNTNDRVSIDEDGYGTIFSGNVGIGTTTPSSFKLEIAGNIGPDADGTRDLGSASRKWNNIYVNNLQFAAASVSGNFDPSADNTYDLGDPSYRWRTGYFGTSLGIGISSAPTQTLSIQGIAGSNDLLNIASSSGTSILRVTKGGNVGIGTTAPGGRLDVGIQAPGVDTPFHYLLGAGANANWPVDFAGIYDANNVDHYLGFNTKLSGGTYASPTFTVAGGAIRWDTVNSAFRIGTTVNGGGMTDVLTVRSGNVGIGTTAPEGLLSFSAAESATVPKIRFQNDAGADADAGISNYTDTGGTSLVLGSNLHTTAYNTYTRFDATKGSAGIDIDNQAGIHFLGGTGAPSELMTILRGGSVGIGTTTPGAKLDISYGGYQVATGGALRIGADIGDLTTRTNATSKFGIISVPHYTNAEESLYLASIYSQAAASNLYIGGGDSNWNAVTGIHLFTAANNTTVIGTERLTILSDGNVGIGTTAPSQELEVVGQIVSTEFTLGNVAGKLRVQASGNTAVFADTNDGYATLKAENIELEGTGSTNYILGNVGIGTTTPGRALSVIKDGTDDLGTTARGIVSAINAAGTKGLYLGYDSAEVLGTIFSQGASSGISFQTHNGASWGERMRIHTNGNVGIGTTAPIYALHVMGNGRFQGTNNIVNLGTSGSVGGGGLIWATNAADTEYEPLSLVGENQTFKVGTAGTITAVTINSTGNVGVGTTTPSVKFQVSEVGGVYPAIPALGSHGGTFEFLSDNNNYGLIGGTNSSGNSYLQVQRVDGTATAYNMLLQPSGGNVGIGTTAPVVPLHINSTSAQSTIQLTNSASGATAADGLQIQASNSTGYLWNFENGPLYFGVNNATAMYIKSDGNVGIGTTAPAYLLQVTGVSGNYTTGFINASTAGNSYGLFIAAGGNSSDYSMRVRARDNTTEYFVIRGDGNVGIGTTNPATFKLQVTGNVGPTTDATYDLGASATRWKNIYASGEISQGGYLNLTNDNLLHNGDFETGTFDGWEGITSVVTGGYAGNYTAQFTGSVTMASDDFIPVDPDYDVIQLEAYVKKATAGGTPGVLYFGYFAYDASRTVITTAPCGTYCYFATSGWVIPVDGNWHKVSATRTGEGTSDPNFPVGTKFIKVLGLVNYGASADAVTQIDHITLKRINNGPLFVGNNFSSTNLTDQYQVSKLYTNSSNHFYVEPPTNGHVILNTSGTGNVGIGTATPGYKLDVNGNARFVNEIYAGGVWSTGYGPGSSGAAIVFKNWAAGELARIDTTSGNVGIGSTNPQQKLAVRGSTSDPSALVNSYSLASFGVPGHVQLAISSQAASPYSISMQVKHESVDNNLYPLVLNPLGGSVGIGTTAPDSALTVKATDAFVDVQSTGDSQNIGLWARYLNSASLGAKFRYSTSSATLTIENLYPAAAGQPYSDIYFKNNSGNTTVMTIKGETASVGIGTTSPATGAKLHVSQGSYNFQDLVVQSALPSMRFADTETNQASYGLLVDGNNMYFDSYTYANRLANAYGTHVMTFSGDNVGIGTTGPGSKLDVLRGSTGEVAVFRATANQGLFIKSEKTLAGVDEANLQSLTSSGSSSGPLAFGTGNDEAMRITTNSYVGIGTTVPGTTLDVNGDITARGGDIIGANSKSIDIGEQTSTDITFKGSEDAILRLNGSYTEFIVPSLFQVNNGFYANGSATAYFEGPIQVRHSLNNDSGTYLTVNGGTSGYTYFSGNVGIGTTAPGATLDVKGYNMRLIGSEGQVSFMVQDAGSGDPGYLDLYRSGAVQVRLSPDISYFNTGNVGIGTTAPMAKLDVIGTIRQSSQLARPLAMWSAGGVTTGAIIIKLPGTTSNYGMIYFEINTYEYDGSNVTTYYCGGHNWSTQWYNYGCNSIGVSSKKIRLAVKDGQFAVVIGDNASTWSYGHVVLSKITNGGYYASTMDLGGTYTITQDASAESYSWISADLNGLDANNIYSAGTVYAVGAVTTAGYYARGGHAAGYLAGSYNNIGENSSKSNPIYTIGTSYAPTADALSNMYGIGYTHSNFWGAGKSTGWGLYTSEAGVIHNTISESGIWTSGSITAEGDGAFNGTEIQGDGKTMLRYSDTYLRLNEDNEFGNGVWMSGSNLLGSTGYWGIGSNGGTTNSSTYLVGSYTGTNYIKIDSSSPTATSYFNAGNVGIGTTSPTSAKLQVNGGGYFTGDLDINGVNAYFGSSAYTNIFMRDDGSTTGPKRIHADSNVIGWLNGAGSWMAYWSHAGNMINSGTINDQTISSGALFTGTVAAATDFRVPSSGAGTLQNSNQFYCNNASDCHFNWSGTGTTYVGNLTNATIIPKLKIAGSGSINKDPVSGFSLVIQGQGNTSSTIAFHIANSSDTTEFYVRDDGYGYLNAGAWAYGSDRRMKENIEYLPGEGLEKILALKPAKFDYINGVRNSLGFIAQEVQEVIPEAVSLDSNTGMLALKTDFIIPYLVNSIKELNTRVVEQFDIQSVNLGVGDIVSTTQNNELRLSLSSHDVYGVVSNSESKIDTIFSGKAQVKVSLENGAIEAGDKLTVSSTQPGVAVRALSAGMIIGMALDSVDTISSGPYTTIQVYVNPTYWAPSSALTSNAVAGSLASSSSSVTVTSTTTDSVASVSQVIATIKNSIFTEVQTLWAKKDIITEGIKKTYYAIADLIPGVDVSTWLSREVTISDKADATTKSVFEGNGAQASKESKLEMDANGNYLATYGVDSTRGEIQLTGSADLINGEAKVFFDYSFTSVISDQVVLRVLITPTTVGVTGQLYVDQKTVYGFTVKELNGSSTGKFDWLIIARRKGFEDKIAPTPITAPSGTPPEAVAPDATASTTPPAPASNPTTDVTPTPTPTPDATALTSEPTEGGDTTTITITPAPITAPSGTPPEAVAPDATPAVESSTPAPDATVPAVDTTISTLTPTPAESPAESIPAP